MVFDRRFTAASPRYLGFSGPAEYRHRRAMPVTEYLCPLDPALLNGERRSWFPDTILRPEKGLHPNSLSGGNRPFLPAELWRRGLHGRECRQQQGKL